MNKFKGQSTPPTLDTLKKDVRDAHLERADASFAGKGFFAS